MDAPKGNWDALSGGGRHDVRELAAHGPEPPGAGAAARRHRPAALPSGEQDWVLDEASEMRPRGPPPRALGQPFGRKPVSFEGDEHGQLHI